MHCFKQHTVVLNVLDDVIYQKKKKKSTETSGTPEIHEDPDRKQQIFF